MIANRVLYLTVPVRTSPVCAAPQFNLNFVIYHIVVLDLNNTIQKYIQVSTYNYIFTE